MPRISPGNISNVIRTLATEKTDKRTTQAPQNKTALRHNKKNAEELRTALTSRLGQINESKKTHELAAEITIREVLIWEFGENILKHPEFSHISKNISKVLLQHPSTKLHLQRLIEQLITNTTKETKQ